MGRNDSVLSNKQQTDVNTTNAKRRPRYFTGGKIICAASILQRTEQRKKIAFQRHHKNKHLVGKVRLPSLTTLLMRRLFFFLLLGILVRDEENKTEQRNAANGEAE